MDDEEQHRLTENAQGRSKMQCDKMKFDVVNRKKLVEIIFHKTSSIEFKTRIIVSICDKIFI